MEYSYSFNLKDTKSKKATLIYLRASIRDENKYLKYSTGEKILPSDWDFETQFPKRINGKTSKAIHINSVINQLSSYGESFQLICTKLKSDGQELTVDQIKKELDYKLKKTSVSPNSFFNVYDSFVKEKKELGKITTSTLKRYINIKEILVQFSKATNYSITFNRVNQDFYVAFVNYSRKTLRHKDNTLGRNIGFIKTFMNWSIKKNYHHNNAFRDFEKTSSETDEVALSFQELESLWMFEFKSKRLEKVRDVFVFGCATGMRYSDYSKIKKANIRDGQIYINSKKQKSIVGIPLNKYSKAVLEKYDYELPIISSQKFREYIKEACMLVGFKDKIIKTSFIGKERIEEEFYKYQVISTHTARRTFITLSLEKGMRPDIVMSITGHKSYSSFKKYIKLSKTIREQEMLKAWS
ncbi:MAG: integrase [Flavobacteriaceae bacterium]|nr:integrase [Flavobacteriaceae bacterium]